MKLTEMFPSRFYKAADLEEPTTLTISDVTLEELGEDKEEKPCINFKDSEKLMALNKTNALVIAAAYGDETGGWKGKTVTLFATRVPFGGKLVDAIRVRI